jgi:N-acetyl-beta-hexosaminidase
MRSLLCLIFIVFFVSSIHGQPKINAEQFPIRGVCIAAPQKTEVNAFIQFIEKEFAPRGVNTLILRVDYNFEYQSHPELRDRNPLSLTEVKKLIEVARKHHIRLIPQVNLLGHQSWANSLGNLLRVYPALDETPHVQIPEKYEWPNADGLYCKSYCPLHPEVHKIVFALVDEICDAFESSDFHAGMDEVFYIGDSKCPRCAGHDKAALFAGEVSTIRNHLAAKNRKLWIWGDRLLDGKTTGIGEWEASMNNTHLAIDLIPKDVLICDWHYERADKTAVYFAMKGFDVVTCPWRTGALGVIQVQDMKNFRIDATTIMRERYQGIVQTIWSSAKSFMDEFYNPTPIEDLSKSQAHCFREVFDAINNTSVQTKSEKSKKK